MSETPEPSPSEKPDRPFLPVEIGPWLAMRRGLFRPVLLARVFFVLLSTWLAAFLAWDTRQDPRLFSVIGLGVSLFLVMVEVATNVIASRKILLAFLGWLTGVVSGQLFYPTFAWLMGLFIKIINIYYTSDLTMSRSPAIPQDIVSLDTARSICHMLFGYFGLVLALRHADWLRPGNLKFYLSNPADRPKVLDSSVIIDGRVVDLVLLKVLEGSVIVPAFVLNEIQSLADSTDLNRRARGRRGLEMLERLREKCPGLEIMGKDYPGAVSMDEKLTRLCRELRSDLVTNDANLQKVAQIHLVPTFNVNEIAQALRPTVYIGERLQLKIVKAGKEQGQGVAYLDDGSMVVVDGGDTRVGREVEAAITSILQNPTGRLIFARVQPLETGSKSGVS